jgi:uncharacterized protein YkwD
MSPRRALPCVLAALALAACGAEAQDPAPDPEVEAPEAHTEAPQTAGDCEDAELVPADGNLDRVRAATLCLVNAERTRRDREPIRDDDDLAEAARLKAQDMVEQTYFDHVGPDGRDVQDWVGETDYLPGAGRGYALGENIGWASGDTATPARLVESWMDSDSHRRNILRRDWQHSGIGVALGAPHDDGGGGATYAHVFGTTSPPR